MKYTKGLYSSLALAISMVFGFVGTSGASSCTLADVTIDGMNATSCGWGTTNNDTLGANPAGWQVNLDSAGGLSNWGLFEKEEELVGSGNLHDGNTVAIGLSVSPDIGNGVNSGTFSLNAFNPTLITLSDGVGTLYHWYLFEGKTGALGGTFDASVILDGKDVSHVNAYISAVPIPAAVWLFGSGLIGLIGLARRKTA